jgi:tripartite-type tricarboxylate transporter receptor subunit TctC
MRRFGRRPMAALELLAGAYAWLALLAPAGTPRPIADRIYQAMVEALKNPAVKARFVQQGAEPLSPGPDELAKFIKSETVKWGEIIHKAGIQPM